MCIRDSYILNEDIVQKIDLVIEERLLVDPYPKHDTEQILNAYNAFTSDDLNDLDDVTVKDLIKLQMHHINLRWNDIDLKHEEFQNYINEEELKAYLDDKEIVHNIDLVIKGRLLAISHPQHDTCLLYTSPSPRYS